MRQGANLHNEVEQTHAGTAVNYTGIARQVEGGLEPDDGYEVKGIIRVRFHLRRQSVFTLCVVLCVVPVILGCFINETGGALVQRLLVTLMN